MYFFSFSVNPLFVCGTSTPPVNRETAQRAPPVFFCFLIFFFGNVILFFFLSAHAETRASQVTFPLLSFFFFFFYFYFLQFFFSFAWRVHDVFIQFFISLFYFMFFFFFMCTQRAGPYLTIPLPAAGTGNFPLFLSHLCVFEKYSIKIKSN